MSYQADVYTTETFFMVHLFAMVAIQSIHLITSLVNCLSDISFTDTWKQIPGNAP